jgi:hypothetical protein
MKKHYFLLVTICISLCSCFGYRHIIGYSGEKLPESQVAIVLTMLPKQIEEKYNLKRYPLMYGIQKVDKKAYGMLQQSAEMLPGTHKINLECNQYSVKKVDQNRVINGKNYEEVWTFSKKTFSITTEANEVYFLQFDGGIKTVKLPFKYSDLKRIKANFKNPGFDLK